MADTPAMLPSTSHASLARTPYKMMPSIRCQLTFLALLFSTLLATVVSTPIGHTAIFSCKTGDGIVFQDTPCPIVQPAKKNSAAKYRYPLAIHKSWFELPGLADERAFCSRKACECGHIEIRHQESLALAVADALYLDGSWHRYESSYQQWLSASSDIENRDHRSKLFDAACHVMMSQTLLREYADSVLTELEQRVQIAENLGFDIIGPCNQGIANACYHYENVKLYKRLQQDAAALSRPRVVGEN